MNTNFKTHIINLLLTDDRLKDQQGELKGNVVKEFVNTLDQKFITLLLEDEQTRTKFFMKIKDVYVFKTNEFKFFLDENSIDNSFTQYSNQIGLSSGGKFFKDNTDVVLNFPFKDCVLEGGQSTEDGLDTYFEYDEKQEDYIEKQSKRKEIFFNEVLAKDEIDRLLEPKAFTNITKYDSKGESKPTKFNRNKKGTITDNLIIKGNNLLALHSLKQEFKGKVKLIYIDPPYNTGNDSFAYNDNFNHSSWLTFMRNRLVVARDLLREDGLIFIQCDDNEQAYLKVLMDEIFKPFNFINTIISKATPNARDYGHIGKMHEYIQMYAKNYDQTISYHLEDKNKKFKYEDDISSFNIHPLYNSNVNFHKGNRPNLYYPFYLNTKNKIEGEFLEISLTKKDGYIEIFPPKSVKDNVQFVWRWGTSKSMTHINKEIIGYKTNSGEYRIIQKMRTTAKVARSIWDETEMSNRRATEDLQKLFSEKVFAYPKSEYLLKKTIQIATKENDIVLDYHLGSGTTAAVAHKMNRQYIGIEQMHYIEDVTAERLKKVIDGEQGGISKTVNWKGGGSFTYLELAKNNQTAKEEILNCNSYAELMQYFETMYTQYFLHYNVRIKEFKEVISQEENFKNLALDRQKEIFTKMLDLNQLYVNLSEMEDSRYKLDAKDIALSKDFYQIK